MQGMRMVLSRGVDFSAQSDDWSCGYQNMRMVSMCVCVCVCVCV
jgi:hypothetical protein